MFNSLGSPGAQAENVQPGAQYTLSIRDGEVAGSFALSPQNAGADDERDSDAALIGAAFEHTFTASGVDDLSRDFGFVPELRIGDRVWLDDDGNGRQNGAEQDDAAGIGGVTVELLRQSDLSAVLASTVTGADGRYFFSSLDTPTLRAGGAYVLRVDMAQGGGALFGSLLPTVANAGDNDAIDSDGERDAQNAQHVLVRATAPARRLPPRPTSPPSPPLSSPIPLLPSSPSTRSSSFGIRSAMLRRVVAHRSQCYLVLNVVRTL